MTDQFNPSEAQIAKVLEKTGADSRKLAIAYLRAQKRARDAESAFKVMSDLNDCMDAVRDGDLRGATSALQRGKRRMTDHKSYFGGAK